MRLLPAWGALGVVVAVDGHCELVAAGVDNAVEHGGDGVGPAVGFLGAGQGLVEVSRGGGAGRLARLVRGG